MVHREDTDLLCSAADEIRHNLAEVDLAKARRSESGADRSPKGDSLRRLKTRGHLSGDHRAKVTVVLEAPRRVGEELRSDIGFQVGVDTEVIAARVRLVGGREARKDLGASR